MSGSLNPTALTRLLGQWSRGAAPAYRELADVVRLLVLDGRVPLDMALPSERALAAALGVSRTTVTAAYASLREQGFLSSGQGSRGRTCIPRQMPAGANGPGGTTQLINPNALAGAPGLAAPPQARPVWDAPALGLRHPRVELGVERVDPTGPELDGLGELHQLTSVCAGGTCVVRLVPRARC